VLSSISDRLSISKADILNPESDNAAVKLALAETHIIQETKTYLESQGVILSSFSSRSRSDTTILVKNIPYGTTAEQIREMFEPHGKLSRVLVPPAGTIALVDFIHPDEANSAFRAVAYRRLGNSIIYLEKGPLGIFKEEPAQKDSDTATSTAFEPVTIPEQHQPSDDNPSAAEVPVTAGSTLFVKNLSFATTTERLAQVFRHLPSFAFARVQYKPPQKRPDGTFNTTPAPRLSLGYGFIGFKTPEAARKAMKSIQRYVLDGHALHVDFAGRGTDGDQGDKASQNAESGKSRTTKMIVKNVPFEATKKDIRELFRFGAVYLPFPKACLIDSFMFPPPSR
jgi:multiple RNA-binding domain-containing protein 1